MTSASIGPLTPLQTNDTDADNASRDDVTDDTLFGGTLRLRQPRGGHRAGTDAVLLAAMVVRATGLVVDVGAGVGTVGLAIARRDRPERTILVEREGVLAGHARHNAQDNGVGDCVQVIETDVLAALPRRNAGVKNDCADLVVTNPPFFDAGTTRASPDRLKQRAHVIEGSLAEWLRVCVLLLRPGGTLAVVHRADALPEIIGALAARTGQISLRAVYPRAGASATRILVRAVKGSRAPLELLPPLILHEASGAWTAEAAAMHASLDRAS